MSAFDTLYKRLMPPRCKDAHKGLYGHVLIVGGGRGMPGAVALAANAALRVGAGKVSIATWPAYANQSLPGLPEVMIHAATDAACLDVLIAKATVCVLGPGLGIDEWAVALYAKLTSVTQPLVMDADALRLLALQSSRACEGSPALSTMPQSGDPSQARDDVEHNWVLTPHPGEAAVLLNCSTHEVQSHREIMAKRIQQQYGGTVVLKGHESLIVDTAQHVSVCQAGNPGMATAGMGDVLSGVIAGLIAQGLTPADAAQLGVWLHATAGDEAALASGERGLIATDLMPFLHRLSNPEKS